MTVVTFTPEAILRMDPTRLGELIQARVRGGDTVIRVEALESIAVRIGIPFARIDSEAVLEADRDPERPGAD